MFLSIRKQHKIIRMIVSSYFVSMMDYFLFSKVASKFLFHNKTMFQNVIISRTFCKRMIGNINYYVSIFINTFTTISSRHSQRRHYFTLIPSGFSFLIITHFLSGYRSMPIGYLTILRTEFSSIVSNSAWSIEKFCTTKVANSKFFFRKYIFTAFRSTHSLYFMPNMATSQGM